MLAHEIGHVFGALDEYAAARRLPEPGSLSRVTCGCKNGNAVKGGTSHDVCIMRGGNEGVAAFKGQPYGNDEQVGGLCPSTEGQVGWVLAPTGIPEVVDTAPTVTVAAPTSTDGTTVTVAGTAGENAWPPGHNAKGRAFSRGISIFVPHDLQVQRRRRRLEPAGNRGRAPARPSRFTTAALGAGRSRAPTRHVMAVQATTGTTASSSVVAWATGTPVTLTLAAGAATIPLGGNVKLTVAPRATRPIRSPLWPAWSSGRKRAPPAARTVRTGAGGAPSSPSRRASRPRSRRRSRRAPQPPSSRRPRRAP